MRYLSLTALLIPPILTDPIARQRPARPTRRGRALPRSARTAALMCAGSPGHASTTRLSSGSADEVGGRGSGVGFGPGPATMRRPESGSLAEPWESWGFVDSRA